MDDDLRGAACQFARVKEAACTLFRIGRKAGGSNFAVAGIMRVPRVEGVE